MKAKRFFFTLFPIVALILEALPYGVVLIFANGEGENLRKTFSYFSLIPTGYANFGPILTAIFTLVLLALALVFAFDSHSKLILAIRTVCIISILTSLMPLMFGTRFFSATALIITLILCTALAVSFLLESDEE